MERPGHENCPCMETCPLNRALGLIGGKWKMQILCALSNNGPTRYNRLKKTLDGVSNTVLANALRELEEDGVIHREVFPVVPPRVEYSLTARGRSLLPILNAMRDWGTDYLHEQNLEPNCSMTGEVCCCEKNSR